MSWDKTVAIGYSYPETDETITHQIVDRPKISNQYLSRYMQSVLLQVLAIRTSPSIQVCFPYLSTCRYQQSVPFQFSAISTILTNQLSVPLQA